MPSASLKGNAEEEIERLFGLPLAMLERYTSGIVRVLQGCTPLEAYEACERTAADGDGKEGARGAEDDADGAFALPEEWRYIFDEENQVWLMPEVQQKCLDLIPKALLEREIERLRAQEKTDPKAKETLRAISGSACLVRADKTGRIAVSASLRERAGIGSAAVLTGAVRIVRLRVLGL